MNKPRPLDELLAAAQTANHLESEAQAARLHVGQAVHSLRSASGMTQTAFAASMGVSQSYLSQIETGVRTPSSSTINLITTTIKEHTDAQEEATEDHD